VPVLRVQKNAVRHDKLANEYQDPRRYGKVWRNTGSWPPSGDGS